MTRQSRGLLGLLLAGCTPPPHAVSPDIQARVAALADCLGRLPVDLETGAPGATALLAAWRDRSQRATRRSPAPLTGRRTRPRRCPMCRKLYPWPWWRVSLLAVVCSLGVLLSGPLNVHADLFGDARRQTPLTLSHADTAGASLRGGLQLQTYLPPQTTTLLQTQATIGGSCGAFDFATSLRQTFEEIPELFEAAGEALLEPVMNFSALVRFVYGTQTLPERRY